MKNLIKLIFVFMVVLILFTSCQQFWKDILENTIEEVLKGLIKGVLLSESGEMYIELYEPPQQLKLSKDNEWYIKVKELFNIEEAGIYGEFDINLLTEG